MANFNTTLASLWNTADSALDTVAKTADTAVKVLNEGSSRLNEWTLLSEMEREITREDVLKNRIENKLLALSEEESKRVTKLSNDTQLNGIYEEKLQRVQSKIDDAISSIKK